MLLLGVLLIIASASVALPTSDVVIYDLEEAESHFKEFINKFERQYESEEEKKMRFELFKNNLRQINELNALRTEDYHATHGITKFADYTQEEFNSLSGLLPSDPNIKKEVLEVSDTNYPEELDWSKLGKVTPVKDQGQCLSCWAFAGVGNIESQYAIKYNELLDLSEQQVVDCAGYGCHGASYPVALDYVKNQGGLESFNDYPYVGIPQTCTADNTKFKVKVSDVQTFQINDELQQFKQILHDQGPVLVGVSAANWSTYNGGILNNPTNQQPDHAVLLVGYGIEQGVPYWLIKNSWGTNWGNQGYIRITAGNNSCNILYVGAITAIVA